MRHWFYTIWLCVYGVWKIRCLCAFSLITFVWQFVCSVRKINSNGTFLWKAFIYTVHGHRCRHRFFRFIVRFSVERINLNTKVESEWERWMWISPTTVLAVLCWLSCIHLNSIWVLIWLFLLEHIKYKGWYTKARIEQRTKENKSEFEKF